MFTAIIENAQGDTLRLTNDETRFQVSNITGIDPPAATVNFTNLALLDGAIFNSSKIGTRNIVITLRINGDIETNRLLLYSMFKTKEKCRFYFKNDSLDVYTDGYVEKVSCPIFVQSELMQISIICMNPYFLDMQSNRKIITNSIALFEFPFYINQNHPIAISEFSESGTTIINNSQNDIGVVFTVIIHNPVNYVEILKNGTGEFIIVRAGGSADRFSAGDVITINTTPGNKSILLTHNGTTTNAFGKLSTDSELFQLSVGENRISYDTDYGIYENVEVIAGYRYEFRGV